MFTGIIQEIGKIRKSTGHGDNLLFEIEAPDTSLKVKIGDSVSVSGACQTVIKLEKGCFSVEAVSETIKRTNLGKLHPGEQVNLELPLALSDLLHGHLVQGHVDCAAPIINITSGIGSAIFSISYPDEYGDYLIEKGSIAVDGVSLTVVNVSPTYFQVSLIPHTLSNTILKNRRAGDFVNLEFDLIAKYIRKMNNQYRGQITPEFLKEHGF